MILFIGAKASPHPYAQPPRATVALPSGRSLAVRSFVVLIDLDPRPSKMEQFRIRCRWTDGGSEVPDAGPSDLSALLFSLRSLQGFKEMGCLRIGADARVPVGRVVRLLDRCQRFGFGPGRSQLMLDDPAE